jgi:hypothetical protein
MERGTRRGRDYWLGVAVGLFVEGEFVSVSGVAGAPFVEAEFVSASGVVGVLFESDEFVPESCSVGVKVAFFMPWCTATPMIVK